MNAHTARGAISRALREGAPFEWLNAAAVSVCVLLLGGLLAMIAVRGLAHFWPNPMFEFRYLDEQGVMRPLIGQIRDREVVSWEQIGVSPESPDLNETVERWLVKTGNRDLTGQEFRWIRRDRVVQSTPARSLTVFERTEWGEFLGQLISLKSSGRVLPTRDTWSDLQLMMRQGRQLRGEIAALEKDRIAQINFRIEKLRLEERQQRLDHTLDAEAAAEIAGERERLQRDYREAEAALMALYEELRNHSIVVRTASGADGWKEVELPLHTIVDAWQPNDMSFTDRAGHFLQRIFRFVTEDPREANTEGGVAPAIFGTVLMVLLMTVFVTPFGVVAGIYLREYARQGFLTRLVRIAVNNLAGVPSIVYGVFGLGFFVYAVGGSIDQLFYEGALPSPTFGTGGLLWASLTLALLTLPVVIVSTEEGLARIPKAIREGSVALGATRWETVWRTVLPMASPGILTGLILAIARAAGEVAPLMLVGVVKLAPSLPVDGNFPFLHLERKFMHLGFHIYDVGFQSPNVEAARPLVYATALLLVAVILLLNLVAINVRSRLREKYRGFEA